MLYPIELRGHPPLEPSVNKPVTPRQSALVILHRGSRPNHLSFWSVYLGTALPLSSTSWPGSNSVGVAEFLPFHAKGGSGREGDYWLINPG
jgi:hypothetical protein